MVANQITTRGQRSADSLPFLTPYGWYSLVLLVVSALTLVPSYLVPLLLNPGALPNHVVLHGAVFIGWYVLVVLQSGLVSRKKRAIHKTLGYLSIPFVVFLLWSGAIMLIGVMGSYQPDWTEQYLLSRTSFVWAILHTLVFFGGFYFLAIAFRKNRSFHMRLILLASLSMIAPSITRVAYLPVIPIDGTAFTLLATYVFLLIPVLMDRHYEGRVHPSFKVGIPAYAVTQILALGLLPATSFGREMAFGI